MSQVKIESRLKFFNLGWFSIFFMYYTWLLMSLGQETKEIENQPIG